jgi:hypothetical protein
MILTSAWSIWFGFRVLDYTVKSMNWPSVQGWIRTVGMGQTVGPTGTSQYSPFVQYSYAVNGTMLSSTMISFADREMTDGTEAQTVENRYALGSKVTVYYCPSSPDIAVLERGGGTARGDRMINRGLIFMLVSIAIAWGSFAWRPREQLAQNVP